MNAEQWGGMALNKDFRSKTGNGSISREGRAIATPTGELHWQHPSLPLSLFIPAPLFSYVAFLLLLYPYWPYSSFLFASSSVFFFHSVYSFNSFRGFDFNEATTTNNCSFKLYTVTENTPWHKMCVSPCTYQVVWHYQCEPDSWWFTGPTHYSGSVHAATCCFYPSAIAPSGGNTQDYDCSQN